MMWASNELSPSPIKGSATGFLTHWHVFEGTIDSMVKHIEQEVTLEEVDGIDGGPTPVSIRLAYPLTDEAEFKLALQVAVRVVRRNEVLQRDGDRLVKATGFAWAEPGDLLATGMQESKGRALGSTVA
jgi:hypothetical protein